MSFVLDPGCRQSRLEVRKELAFISCDVYHHHPDKPGSSVLRATTVVMLRRELNTRGREVVCTTKTKGGRPKNKFLIPIVIYLLSVGTQLHVQIDASEEVCPYV